MWRLSIAVLAFVCVGGVVSAQDQPKDSQAAPAASKIPPEDSKKPNPVKPSASSIADGKHLYESQCLMCHGKGGDGKGDLATDMKLNLRDFHDAATFKDTSDGDIFYIISKGKGDMPGGEDRLSETQRWNLVNYIHSLSGKTAAAKSPDTKAADAKPKDTKQQ